jgi:hypothetical protein
MNRFYFFAPLFAASVACSGAAPTSGSSHQAVSTDSSKTASVDSIGCGDGVKSTPNIWFVSIPSSDADQGGLFQEIALMSSNLFWLQGITAVNPASDSGSLAYPVDTTQTTALTFEVNFTPGQGDTSSHTTYRDQALTQLQGLGAQIGCNQIGVAQPLNSGSSSGSGTGTAQTPDSAGCGDGVNSAPNAWFITINRTSDNAPLFDEVTLMASNLFGVTNVFAINPATNTGSLVYPEDVTQTSSLDFDVQFSPGVDSLALPTVASDSITYRDQTLTTLVNDGLQIDCNTIGHVKPL